MTSSVSEPELSVSPNEVHVKGNFQEDGKDVCLTLPNYKEARLTAPDTLSHPQGTVIPSLFPSLRRE